MPECINPKHLFSGTNKDNMYDMVIKGRARNGYTTLVGLRKMSKTKNKFKEE
jgi:hypothetical protein